MKGPYGFEMSEHCLSCHLKRDGFFCQLTPKASKDFESIRSNSVYPEGAVLFLEKQEPRGLFMLCEGEVKLSISSSEGKRLILRIARAGEILGLMPVLSGKPYEVTAETLHPCQIAFVRRQDFLRFITLHPDVSQSIVRQMTTSYQGVCEQLRTVGLTSSAPEKLAKLLLDWSAGAEDTKAGTRVNLPLTHEEIAEFIGSTRETVTRTLSEFKSRELVTLKGSTLVISNRAALQSLVSV